MKNHLRLYKVPLSSLIHILSSLYEEGVDYIDIEGQEQEGEENDVIKVTARPEYYINNDGVSEESETDPEYLLTEVKSTESDFEDINPIEDDFDINDLI
jgi:hypothetical protein